MAFVTVAKPESSAPSESSRLVADPPRDTTVPAPPVDAASAKISPAGGGPGSTEAIALAEGPPGVGPNVGLEINTCELPEVQAASQTRSIPPLFSIVNT